MTARMMVHPWGRWAVGIAGAVVIGVGAALVYEGLARKFEKRLKSFTMTPTQRKVVVGLGVVGTSARGVRLRLGRPIADPRRGRLRPTEGARSGRRAAFARAD